MAPLPRAANTRLLQLPVCARARMRANLSCSMPWQAAVRPSSCTMDATTALIICLAAVAFLCYSVTVRAVFRPKTGQSTQLIRSICRRTKSLLLGCRPLRFICQKDAQLATHLYTRHLYARHGLSSSRSRRLSPRRCFRFEHSLFRVFVRAVDVH